MMSSAIELQNILTNKSIKSVYQPIISLHNGDILGYEALMRGPTDSFLRSPLELLSIAKNEKKIFELEMLSREKAISGAKDIPKNCLLFINVEPDVIKDSHYKIGHTKGLLEQVGLCEKNIVLEITEGTAINDYSKYIELIDNYKHQGYRIAIDDVGSGYSGLTRINHTKPDFIKIDMELTRDVNKDSFKQSLMISLVKFAAMTGMKTIAEGIETKEELETVIRLGINYGQGYFISRPCDEAPKMLHEVKDLILNMVYNKDRLSEYDIYTCKIGTIAETVEPLKPETSSFYVKDYLSKKQAEGVAIVNEKNEPIGLMMKTELVSQMATQYGYSIYAKRPVMLLMDQYPIIVDYNTPIKRVSEVVTLRDPGKVYDNIIVTKDDFYYGVVSVRNLLQQITSIETDYARHLNPLTMLPGNKIINSIIAKRIGTSKKIAVCYFDLDNFKIYNDVYGFENGDKVIRKTAKIIEKYIQEHYPIDSFIGHIGGDDFVAFINDNTENIEEVLVDILSDFAHGIIEFFNQEDIEKGKIYSVDRNNMLKEFDITSLSIGTYIGDIQHFGSIEKFGEHIGRIKKMAKEIRGNSYVVYSEGKVVKKYFLEMDY